MDTHLKFIVFVLLFTITGCNIEGTVTSQLGAPVEGITITLNGETYRTTTTDSNGKYVFKNVPTGEYTIEPIDDCIVFEPEAIDVTKKIVNKTEIDILVLRYDCIVSQGDITVQTSLKGVPEGATCAEAGNISLVFEPGSVIAPDTYITLDLNTNVTLCENYATTINALDIVTEDMLQGSDMSFQIVGTKGSRRIYVSFLGIVGSKITVTDRITLNLFDNDTDLLHIDISNSENDVIYAYLSSADYVFTFSQQVAPIAFAQGDKSISGKITDSENNSLENATVYLKKDLFNLETTTDAEGNYTFSQLPANDYTISPFKSCWTFSPSFQAVDVTEENKTDVNFEGDHVCQNDTLIWEGDCKIYDQEDVAALSGYTEISGNLEIGIYASYPAEVKVTDLSGLSCLGRIRGDLEITYNLGLETLNGLNNLTRIGGSFVIESNTKLTDLDALSNLFEIDGYIFRIRNNRSLKNMAGLSGVLFRNDQYMGVIGNDALESLEGFSHLASCESLKIYENPLIKTLEGLEGLTTVGFGGLGITGNIGLLTLEGLENLITVNGPLVIGEYGFTNVGGNHSLTDLSALGSLQSVISLSIQNNRVLTTLGLTSLQTVSSETVISGNAELCNDLVYELADQIDGQITFYDNKDCTE